jgi:hypothetical protein
VSDLEKCINCGRLAEPGATVTISADEYAALVQFRRRHQLAAVRLKGLPPRSRLSRDPEVAEFVLSNADSMLVNELREACVATFGEERCPSRSSIHRFIQRNR